MITPHGGALALHAEVSIAAARTDLDSDEQMVLLTAQPGDSQWTVLSGATYDGGAMRAPVMHFSYFQAVTLVVSMPSLTLDHCRWCQQVQQRRRAGRGSIRSQLRVRPGQLHSVQGVPRDVARGHGFIVRPQTAPGDSAMSGLRARARPAGQRREAPASLRHRRQRRRAVRKRAGVAWSSHFRRTLTAACRGLYRVVCCETVTEPRQSACSSGEDEHPHGRPRLEQGAPGPRTPNAFSPA